MDLSVVAAVGSFAFSERVLKPKATVLVILGMVLVYDLATKTQDVASLRVYRGPIMLVFTIMMLAYSLRKWRRNGIACDEFLFLPGSQHGHQIGIEGPLIESIPSEDESEASPQIDADGSSHSCEKVEMISLPSSRNNESKVIRRNSFSSIGDDSSEEDDETHDNKLLLTEREVSDGSSAERSEHSNGTVRLRRASAGGLKGRFYRCIEKYPHLAQLWTFFFNRSAGSANASATYAPSGPSVFGASLDLSMPVLFNCHVFIITFNHVQKPEYTGSELPLNMLPVGFLAVLYARAVIPPSRRARFWRTIHYAVVPPFHSVNVRDEFIGDCLTSWVRPAQDLLFGFFYFFVVIWGTLSGKYGLTRSGEILDESWWVHNLILPLVAILPLWLKYLQTLRQAYDANQRWPYLGNAFKYLSASMVIIYGIRHPEERWSKTWMICFAFAMVYQILWDVVMDWEFFEIQRDISVVIPSQESSTISSFRPQSRMLLGIHLYLIQPFQDCCCSLWKGNIQDWRNIRLRQRRLYKNESFYWKILAFNVLTRFAWMFSFLPHYHLSESNPTTATLVLTSNSEVKSYWGVLLPTIEIVRRTLWGFLYLEKETIKMMDGDAKYQRTSVDESEEMSANSKFDESRSLKNQLLPTWLGKQQQVAHSAATTRAQEHKELVRNLFLLELSLWGGAFVVLGALAAM